MTEPRKSPIKDKPLRHAGQSLEEERRELLSDTLESPMLVALLLIVMAALEWWRYFFDMKLQPAVFTVAALAAAAWAALRVYRARARLRSLSQGIEGERAVGQYLERLRGQGYEVFHDIVGPGFNVDHVVIGPAGVLTVETKTWSKPARGDARIVFDGEQLTVAGMTPDRSPILQARAQAAWLRGLLSESTGRKFEVLPVVLFPGWFVDQSQDSRRSIWVLEPKALPSFLEREPNRLDTSESKLAAYHLSRFIRSEERGRAVT